MTAPVHIHQIYYNEATRLQIDPQFIPLDNTTNSRPDWYEFWVIRNYLKNHELEKDAFHGFFSPKFTWKTGLSGDQVKQYIEDRKDKNVFLFSPAWDQIAYFLNPFEQGDYWHPQLLTCTQNLINQTPFAIDLQAYIGHSLNTCFSNYVVAKSHFWHKWLALADLFFGYVESSSDERLSKGTTYGTTPHLVPMKTFIQERFISVILAHGAYDVAAYDFSQNTPLLPQLYGDHLLTRQGLQACDQLKQRYSRTNQADLLAAYWAIRNEIPLLIPRSTLKSDL